MVCGSGVNLTYLLRGLSPQANYTDRATAVWSDPSLILLYSADSVLVIQTASVV
jgi:hypothetical protein